MVFGGVGVGLVIACLLGCATAPPAFLIGEPLAIGADLVYRARVGGRHWFHPHCGGHIGFLPVWVVGIMVIVLILVIEM
jgi:hypothetical protein